MVFGSDRVSGDISFLYHDDAYNGIVITWTGHRVKAVRQIIANAGGHIHGNGHLLLEHGFDQADAVARLLRDAGFNDVSTHFDFGGQARCTGGRWHG